MSAPSSPRATSPPSPLARLQQALEERHGWKRLDDEDPEEAAATAVALASAPIGTAVTVRSRRADTCTVTWSTSTKHITRPPRGQKPRAGRHEARPARAATRREGASSATSSSDPPADGESESDGGAHKHRCAAPWCDHPVYGPTQKKYCGVDRCDQARDRERQRQSRHRNVDLVEAERREALLNARLAGMIGSHAFAPAGEHSLSFLWGTRWSPKKIVNVDSGDPGEQDARALWVWCRCNGHHIDDGDGGCFRCGHWREAVAV